MHCTKADCASKIWNLLRLQGPAETAASTHIDTLVEEAAVDGIWVVAGVGTMLSGCRCGEGDGSVGCNSSSSLSGGAGVLEGNDGRGFVNKMPWTVLFKFVSWKGKYSFQGF